VRKTWGGELESRKDLSCGTYPSANEEECTKNKQRSPPSGPWGRGEAEGANQGGRTVKVLGGWGKKGLNFIMRPGEETESGKCETFWRETERKEIYASCLGAREGLEGASNARNTLGRKERVDTTVSPATWGEVGKTWRKIRSWGTSVAILVKKSGQKRGRRNFSECREEDSEGAAQDFRHGGGDRGGVRETREPENPSN